MSRVRLRKAGPASAIAGLAVLAAVTLAGCDTVALVNALTPSGSYALHDGIRYGDHARQRMDLYLPTVTPHRQTVIVFVYGGAWSSGAREQYRFVGQAFSELGYVTVIPDHRLYPDVTYPAFVDDIARAMAATPPLLADLSCSREWRYVVAGHSSGAHTAALLAIDPGYLAEQSTPVRAAALVGLAGPYDLPLDDPLVNGKFDDRPSDAAVKPVRLAGPDSPPALLLHGGGDETVHPLHTQRLAAALSDAGVDVTATLYPDVDHRTLVGALAKPLRLLAPTRQDIEDFLREQDLDDSCGPGTR